MTCEQLMAELHAVKMEHIALVATEYATLSDRSSGIDVWTIVGGAPGLLRMYTNSGLLLALAEQAKAWSPSASAEAQERMEKDVLLMRHAAMRTLYNRVFVQRRSVHLGETITTYYSLADRLLTLYEQSPSCLYTRLTVALGQA